MKQFPRWLKIETWCTASILFIIFLMSNAITIIPWKEKNRYDAFIIASVVALVVWIISFFVAQKKKE